MTTARTAPKRAPAETGGLELAARLRLVITRLARRLRQQAEAGVSPTQISALATVERRGPLTLGELAACEHLQPPTVTAAVARLEESGLVARHVDTHDRRIARLEITGRGRQLLARSRRRKSEYLDRRLRRLDADERATLARAATILERIVEDGP